MEKGTKGARSLLGLAAGRRAKWAVLVLWLVVAVLSVVFGRRLESVQKNERSSFLPADAESTRVVELEERFATEEAAPAVVVYRREGGLEPADFERAEADRRAVESAGLRGAGTPSPPIPSEDGDALLFAVPIVAGEDVEVLAEAVEEIRDEVGAGAGGGLEVAVTGPAGFSADLVEVFGSIDTRLLLATAAIVALLLLLTYRSPFLWLVPLVAVGLADAASRASSYFLAEAGLTISGQTAGLVTVLVFGAGTDYALLLVARYRDELRRHEDEHEAMARALRRAGPAILASAGTVAVGLLCLLAAELNSNRSLGPVAAVGILLALLAMLTALPALLLVAGRRVFWPYVPRYGSASREGSRLFAGIGRLIYPRPRRVWVFTALALAAMALGLFRLDTGLNSSEAFRAEVESVRGQDLISASYPAGTGAPATVVAPQEGVERARAAASELPGVARVGGIERAGDLARFDVTLEPEPYGEEAFDAVSGLRERVKEAAGPDTLVGGPSAQELDVRQSALRDAAVVVPLVLLAVLAILGLLLRAVVAPLVLAATVVLSFAAALGASVIAFESLFGFPGIDPGLPLLAFLFLVALGVDYNIFLMDRAREEAARVGTGRGMLRALAVTGGVITSAGLVLAGTFSVLGVLPLVVLTEIGFVVAFGVLLDTFVVRSVLVPALVLDAGSRIWWPGSPSRKEGVDEGRPEEIGEEDEAVPAVGSGRG